MDRNEQNYSAALSQVSQYDALANMTLVAAGSPLGATCPASSGRCGLALAG